MEVIKDVEEIGKMEIDLYTKSQLMKYITNKQIADMSKHAMTLKVKDVNDKAGCKIVHDARIVVKHMIIEVEDTRKGLNVKSLKFCRDVNGEAKRIVALLLPIRDYLASQEKIVEDEKIRIKVEKARIEKERLEKEEAERMRVWEEEQARIKAEQEKEAKRLEVIREEQEERERHIREEQEEREAAIKRHQVKKEKELWEEKEKIRLEQELKENKIKDEQEARELQIWEEKQILDTEKREFEERKEREEEERLQKIKWEKASLEAIEKAKEEEAERIKREHEKEELRLLLLPDKEKLFAFSDLIISLDAPIVKHARSKSILSDALEYLNEAATTLRKE
ncbi:hypothetical protein LCGC14_2406780 [marine sediment metagenome]|uniref:Uncharacterized protein n=1 Tax=marine sediment metagenome TaxID=412755 RepID=A0A0F9EN62_9ZZZZ